MYRKKKRKSQAKHVRPQTIQSLACAVRKGRTIDRRTAVGQLASQVRDQLEGDLVPTARALLLNSASHSAVVASMALKKAMADTEGMLSGSGVYSQCLGIYQRFDSNMRSALSALKKFKEPEEESRAPESLSDLIVNNDFDPGDPVKTEGPDPGPDKNT